VSENCWCNSYYLLTILDVRLNRENQSHSVEWEIETSVFSTKYVGNEETRVSKAVGGGVVHNLANKETRIF
jgi:hypothetical protein